VASASIREVSSGDRSRLADAVGRPSFLIVSRDSGDDKEIRSGDAREVSQLERDIEGGIPPGIDQVRKLLNKLPISGSIQRTKY